MKGHAGVFVAARLTQEGIEIRCRLCAGWWPADREFFEEAVSICRACSAEVRRERVLNIPGSWDPQDSYEHLRSIREHFAHQVKIPGLSVAVRRAYWREKKRAERAAA